MLSSLYEHTLSIDDDRMTYIKFGHGKKNLVLISGLSLRSIHGSGLILLWMYRLFIKDYTVYIFEPKETIPLDYTIDQLADDLAKVLVKLKLKNADVIGISMGGMIAQSLAIHHPELVHALVLGVTLSRTNETIIRVINHWIQCIEEDHFSLIIDDMYQRMYSQKYVRKYKWLIALSRPLIKLQDQDRFLALAKACLTCSTYDHLDQITCPVFVIGAREDGVVTGEASLEIAKRLQCPVYLYEDFGHAAYEEASDFNQRIYDFLKAQYK